MGHNVGLPSVKSTQYLSTHMHNVNQILYLSLEKDSLALRTPPDSLPDRFKPVYPCAARAAQNCAIGAVALLAV